MNLTISGHHLEVTPALRGYVTHKLDRVLRHFDQVVDVRVLLSVEKQKEKEGRQRAECNIHVKGSDLFAECASEDLYAAVDELVDKLDRQVVRHKDRLQDLWAATLPNPPPRRAALPTHRMASSQAFVDASLAGLGWGMNPEPLVARHLAEGSLIDLSPDHPLDVALHWQFTRLTAQALQPVTRAIRSAAATVLLPLSKGA